MNTKLLNVVADAIDRSQKNGKRTPMGIAIDLESACLVQSPETAAELENLRARVVELEAQLDRRRERLVALQNDALDMRGSLSPNGQDRKVPFPLGETLTPAVDWLIARVAELETALAARTASEETADGITRRIAPTQALRETEGEHYAAVHHSYKVPRDLPETTPYTATPEAHAQMRAALTDYFSGKDTDGAS